MAGHGFAVAIHSNHSRAEGEALLAAIESKGGKGCVVEADLTDSDATRRLVSQVQHELGPVQLLVNNASVFQEDAIGNLADDVVWNNHFAVHVKAPVLLADAVASLLPDGQDGLIVNIIDQRVWKLTPKFTVIYFVEERPVDCYANAGAGIGSPSFASTRLDLDRPCRARPTGPA